MVAAGMLVVYKTGAIRVTPRFTRMLIGATIGVVGLMVVNLIASFFTSGGLGLRDGGPIAILFSLVCIAIAAFNLVMDFDMIEQGIRHGVDQKFAWYASFGLVVTLVWLYFELLRPARLPSELGPVRSARTADRCVSDRPPSATASSRRVAGRSTFRLGSMAGGSGKRSGNRRSARHNGGMECRWTASSYGSTMGTRWSLI